MRAHANETQRRPRSSYEKVTTNVDGCVDVLRCFSRRVRAEERPEGAAAETGPAEGQG